ncbi:MAG TPA: hypothetical protein VHX62_03410 [Solirubrobacteraceae bacterium]|jgi:hypothetical protein|nr:hypothetical protein [Solirubrobacteraceae bacterium]
MSGSLHDPAVRSVLERLHAAATHDDSREPGATSPPGANQPLSAAERAKQREHIYMPISREAGTLCSS